MHTKGPWKTTGEGFAVIAPEKQSKEWGVCCIAEVGDEQWRNDDGIFLPASEERANAQLIAAAPELLEACKSLLAMHMKNIPNLKIGLSSDDIAIEGSARGAINRAEGR